MKIWNSNITFVRSKTETEGHVEMTICNVVKQKLTSSDGILRASAIVILFTGRTRQKFTYSMKFFFT